MTVPPAFSTFSAVTELFVTAAVAWFFYRGWRFRDYRFGLITVALVYETLFNISYMVYRSLEHEEGVTHEHPGWVTGFVVFHGTISLAMFLGLVAMVVWAYQEVRGGQPNPIAARPVLTVAFLGLWGVSILTGEVIYALYWTGTIHAPG